MNAPEPIRILLVEDDEDDYILTRDLLAESRRASFQLEWAANYDRAVEAMAREPWDVILADYRLGAHDGLEILREAEARELTTPIILLTGAGDRDVDLAAMEAGAADYLVKGNLDAETLERAIRYSLAQSRTLAALRESEQRYALSVRGANDGLWVWDLVRHTVYYSPRWKAMLGWNEDEIADSPEEWFGRIHPGEVEVVRMAIEMHRRAETPAIEVEHRMYCRDGTYRWMLTRGLAQRDATGEATRLAGSMTDMTERKQALERLTHDAFHDSLTQMPNRALFMDRLERSLQKSHRDREHRFAVLFIDLDRFKLVNDSLGHAFGDEVLVAVSERFATAVRAGDTVARLGGDEFTILLDSIEHAADAVRTSHRIQEALVVPVRIRDQEIFLTASIGIALSASGYDRPQDVLRDADIAMYRAKGQGRARHEVFDRTMHDSAVELLRFETDLRRAMDRGELRVHYQPIVSLDQGIIAGFEALVRWQRGDVLVPAAEIVRVAEDAALIVPIGQWVLNEALRQLVEWNRLHQGPGPLEMHVNLSARQLLQPDIVPMIINAIRRSGAAPQHLHLELTETALIENADVAAKVIEGLRKADVRVSLDDFGTGYSSLSSLRQYRFDTLKIDRSFISPDGARRDDEIVRTISKLARLMGMAVTVEGLETAGQLARMRSIAIDFGQGYYFSPPVPATVAGALLNHHFRD
ncbi:MAG: EAL domain-containing protein [Acidobacteria bacterium]|nr:EAL domain-containing protein [Acidobacteriota bacterium]